MPLNVFASSGGGVRIGASFGAEVEGEHQVKFHWSMFDYYVGTSAGALDAALTANKWSGERKVKLFLDTNFGAMFSPFLLPFAARKALALTWPISLRKLSDFFDSLNLKPHPHLLVNSVDAEDNIQTVFCEELPDWNAYNLDDKGQYTSHDGKIRWVPKAFSSLGFGTVLTRSMVLPGLVADEPRWKDGGVAENPLLSALPMDSRILLLHLGYAGMVKAKGDTTPKGLIAEALYDYEFKAYSYAEHLMAHFPNLKPIFPGVYDVDSAAFNLGRNDKAKIVERGRANSRAQW